jgi:hypothetical protein
MATKIRITESQLKNLIKNKKSTKQVEPSKVDEKPVVSESIQKIKSDFKRYL